MINRCYSQSNSNYPNYGGRGISICDRWRNSFEEFYKDMGDPPTIKHELDRINNDGNYEPGNCRWTTHTQQMKNRRKFKVCDEIMKIRTDSLLFKVNKNGKRIN